MSIDFYRALEDQFRESREIIKKRLQVYQPFISVVKSLYPQGPALDLGCGRGEWLEVLKDNGITAYGVDLDDGMLEACRKLGLEVETVNAIDYLQKLPNDSQAIVSGFHLAEHLKSDDLHTLIKEALRVLKPAGLLILETPNAENITVATTNFYLDPTHDHPIPSKLLRFLTEFHGFARGKVLGLQESPEVKLKQFPSLYQIFNDASPDYAVIAQKTGNAAELAQFDDLFNQVFGLSLHELANRYDSRIDTLDQRQTASEINIQRFNTNLQEFNKTLQEFNKTVQDFEQKLLVVEDKTLLLEQRMAKILKILAPFKWLKRQISK